MSTKHLQRIRELQKQQQQAETEQSASSEGESSETDEDRQPAQLQFNPFSLIESDGEGADIKDSDSEDRESNNEVHDQVEPAPKPAPESVQPHRKGGGKQAKKRARAAAAAAKATASALGSGRHTPQSQATASTPSRQTRSKEAGQSVLSVNVKRLKGDDELKRIFGAGVFAEEAREAARSRGRGGRGGGRGRVPLKGGLLVVPKPHWPPFSGGLSMRMCERDDPSDDGSCSLFLYEYSSHYRATQELYEQAQASNDVNAVAALLQRTPYHADALLTLFDLHRSMGEHAQAEDMLQMALYGFEEAWHHSFNPAAADVTMNFDEPANRSFFLALFYHVQGLSRRGLHRTALEVGKLLLALDEEDPLGMTFFLDFLAVCAQEHQFIARMCSFDAPGGTPMSTLPNWAFALALAARHAREQPSTASGLPVWGGDGEIIDPSSQLRRAVISCPLAVQRLMAKLNGQGAAKGLEWQALLNDPFFVNATDHDSATYSHVVDLFVERHHLLWKSPEILDWLKEACQRVIADKGFDGSSAEDWAQVTSGSFPATSHNNLRQLRLQDFSDNIATIPREEVEAGIRAQAEDAEAQEIQAALAAVAAQVDLEPGRPERGVLLDGNMPTLEMMLRSLLPSFNADDVESDNTAEQQLLASQQAREDIETAQGVQEPNDEADQGPNDRASMHEQ